MNHELAAIALAILAVGFMHDIRGVSESSVGGMFETLAALVGFIASISQVIAGLS